MVAHTAARYPGGNVSDDGCVWKLPIGVITNRCTNLLRAMEGREGGGGMEQMVWMEAVGRRKSGAGRQVHFHVVIRGQGGGRGQRGFRV